MVFYTDIQATRDAERGATPVKINIMACEYAFKITIMEQRETSKIISTKMVWYPLSNLLLGDTDKRVSFLKKHLEAAHVTDIDAIVLKVNIVLDRYWKSVTKHSAIVIQRYWRGWRSRRIFNAPRMRLCEELALLPPGAIHGAFPGGAMFAQLNDKYALSR